MKLDYLSSACERVHAINCTVEGASMEAGILCLIAYSEDTVRLCSDTHKYIVELPKEFRSSSERVKVFNAVLTILDHEQV